MVIQGIAAAPGIVIGRALVKKSEEIRYVRRTIAETERAEELARLRRAVQESIEELERIKERTRLQIGEAEARIFEAHQLFLQDPDFIGAVESAIADEGVNAEAALAEVRDRFVTLFESMDNEYMRERAADLRDVSQRVLRNLTGKKEQLEGSLSSPIVLVVHDLTPSDTAQLDRERVKGFLTEIGGRTSHSAIMARTMEIPAVVGLSAITDQIQNGDTVIVDGLEGKVHIRPDQDVIDLYEKKQREYAEQKELWGRLAKEATVTRDGKRVELAANIGNPQEAGQAAASGAEAIGLFRTEFLYMGRDQFPSEEEQFEAYKAAAEAMEEKPVVIRTLDIGGDKELAYLSLPKELNPFLGYRAIRLCLDRPELFKTQLRALLRASTYGNIKIMYPMIATLGELRRANQLLEEAKAELRSKHLPYNEELQVGIMIEVPAAAMIADQLAREVDFFSIGTNDLIQYMMAADRMNEQVSYLYDPFHPAVLRMIRQVIEAAHQAGKWVGMCGEMAGEELAVPILLGLGLDEFSMSAASILRTRHLMKRLDTTEMKAVAQHALTLESGQEIRAYIKEQVLQKL